MKTIQDHLESIDVAVWFILLALFFGMAVFDFVVSAIIGLVVVLIPWLMDEVDDRHV